MGLTLRIEKIVQHPERVLHLNLIKQFQGNSFNSLRKWPSESGLHPEESQAKHKELHPQFRETLC